MYRKLTPLTRDYNTNKMTTRVINLFDEPINSASLQQAMTRLQRKSNVVSIQSENDPYVKSRIRKPMMRCHSFRKIFNTICIQNNMNHSVKEKLMGHKTKLELDFNYFRPTEQHLINEYLKIIPDLTIDESHRLQKQVEVLSEKNQDSEYIIKGKLQELVEQNKTLTSKIQEYEEIQKEGRIMSKDHAQKFADIYDKLNELMDQRKEERRRSRDYEMTTDFLDRDTKFDILSITFERTLQKQNDLERTLLEQETLLKEKGQKQQQ